SDARHADRERAVHGLSADLVGGLFPSSVQFLLRGVWLSAGGTSRQRGDFPEPFRGPSERIEVSPNRVRDLRLRNSRALRDLVILPRPLPCADLPGHATRTSTGSPISAFTSLSARPWLQK